MTAGPVGLPQRPALSGVPGGAPGLPPPAMAPMPMAAPAATAGAPPAGAPPPGSPAPGGVPGSVTDLSIDLHPGWQLVDFASRQIAKALKSGAFYQEPEAKAGLTGLHQDLEKLISSYAKAGATMGPEGNSPRVAPSGEDSTYVESPSA